MSMHFAPQWVKPIKPTGLGSANSTTPSSDVLPPLSAKSTATAPSHPFPALNPGRSSSPSTLPSNPALSYSRITNASQSPQSPSFPSDGGFSPYENGNGHPFRYSRDQILALWDEEKVKEVPIELAELMENGGVLVSREAVKPIGLRELSEVEKKLLSTSVHPTMPTRQRMATGERPDRNDRDQPNGHATRRSAGPLANGKDNSAPGSGRGAFGGFGRGEGGAFGGGKIGTIGSGPPSAGLETRGPGTLGGGFGGVPKRLGTRRTESSDMGADAISTPPARGSAPWRTTRTHSGNFEGVLGFGQSQPAPLNSSTSEVPPSNGSAAGWRDRQDKERQEADKVEEKEEAGFGKGGGPGWGNGQKKWRLAAGADTEKTLEIPIAMPNTESVAATASATPVPERDASLREIPLPQAAAPPPAPQPDVQEKEDLGVIEWFYRDPNGQEQGPFTGTQMHEWYSHAYFTDDLPLRRASETSFHTLSELKVATGNGVQPFLAPVRPRLPPNLPIPATALPPISPSANGIGHPVDAFRNMTIQPPSQPQPPYNQFPPAPFSPTPYGQFQSPAFGSPAAAAPWSGMPGLPPQRQDNYAIRSPFGTDPFGGPGIGGPQPYSPAPGAPIYPQQAYGAPPPNPWGTPGAPVPQMQHAQMYPQTQAQPVMQEQQSQQPYQQIEQPTQQQPPQQQQEEVQQTVEDVPSYFPPVETPVEQDQEETQEEEPVVKVPAVKEKEQTPPPVAPEPTVSTPTPAPASVWGQVAPASRKQSLSSQPASASTTAKLPTAPSSLPPKPSSVSVETAAPKIAPTTPSVQTPVDKPALAPKPVAAPWAVKEDKPATPTGPSLRDIQQAEARVAEARRAALSEARAAMTPPPQSANDDVPSNMSWGLPSSGSGKTNAVSSPAVAQAPTPAVWGSGDAGPKKTLKQIQEEEEKRKKLAAAKAQAVVAAAGGSAVNKRGYADLAAQASSTTPPAGWSTVGLGGKVIPGAAPKPGVPSTQSAILKPSIISTPTKSTIPTPATSARKPAQALEDVAPSVDFLKWTKTALSGLKIPIDDFIQMLLTFPVDPPANSRADVLEIISDSVYANSSTLDGRRFALEFYEKRKADAKRGGAGAAAGASGVKVTGAGGGSLADVVKSVPAKKEDIGFKVVKAKGKKKN